MNLQKWTYHRGAICLVHLWKSPEGKFSGFMVLNSFDSVSWYPPMDEPPPGQFFDTENEAFAGALASIENRLVRYEGVKTWLAEQIHHIDMFDVPGLLRSRTSLEEQRAKRAEEGL